MSSGYGENSKPDGNSNKYVGNTTFWDNLKKEKERKEKEAKTK